MSAAYRRGLGVALVSFVVSAAFWSPAFWHWDESGYGDWQQFHHWWEIGVVSIRRWGEWPLWDPHHCGGVSQWGQPQAQNWSPLYLLFAVPFGTTLGHKLFLLAHACIGFSGLYVYARREEGLRKPGALLGAIIWCSSGFYTWHASGGHSTFLAFYYYPWLLLCWRWAHKDVRYSVAVAAIMTELLLEGGHYPAPYAVVLLAFDSIVRFRFEKARAWSIVRTILVGGGLTAFLGAMRWVPILIAMHRHPRPISDDDSLQFWEVVQMWTAREPSASLAGHEWVWAEYGTYVGWPVLFLCAGGILIAAKRGRFVATVGALLFLAFSMGNRGPLWPSPLLHHVPFVSNLHVPARWQVVCTMYMGLLAGTALDALDRALARRRWHRDVDFMRALLPWMLVLAVTADLFVVAMPVVDRWRGAPIPEERESQPHLVRTYRYHEEYANYPSRDVGTMECYDAVPWHRSRSLWTGEVPQVRIMSSELDERREPREGDELISYERTNHTVTAVVVLGSPGRVVFNQNFEQQWTASTGTVVDDDLRMAVDLPAGRHTVVLRFEPDDLPYSLYASLFGVLLCWLVLWPRRRSVLGA